MLFSLLRDSHRVHLRDSLFTLAALLIDLIRLAAAYARYADYAITRCCQRR